MNSDTHAVELETKQSDPCSSQPNSQTRDMVPPISLPIVTYNVVSRPITVYHGQFDASAVRLDVTLQTSSNQSLV